MNLKDITLSYPAIRYKVNVSHFTSRHSTAMEWLILEVTQKAMMNPQLEGVPISTIFESVFLINDVNQMIKPCIQELRDSGALITENIYDEADLSKVPMRCLRLTEEGQKMQRDGLLPGKTTEDSISVTYDPIGHTLISENVNDNYSDTATGFHVSDVETPESVTFPSALVMDYLAEAKRKMRYKWMTQTTQIHEAVPAQATVLWKNTFQRLEVGENWQCNIAADVDGSIAANLLSEMAIELPVAYDNVPSIQSLNPDFDIKQLIDVTEIKGFLYNLFEKESLLVVDKNHFSQDKWNSANRKAKGLRVAIIDGTGNTTASIAGNRLIVSVPDRILNSGEIYQSKDTIVCVGSVHLNASDVTRNSIFGYVPTTRKTDELYNIITHIVENYSIEHHKLLYLFLEIGEEKRFLESVGNIVKRLDSLSDRRDFLDSVNRDGIQIYGKKLLPQNQYSVFLLNVDEIKEHANSFEGIEHVISDYANLTTIRSNDDLLRMVVRTALETGAEPRNIEELWHLWKHLQTTKKSLIQWINRDKLYARFYTPEIVEEIAKKVSFIDETAIEGFTPIETAFLDVERTVKRVLACLPELDITKDYSSERVLECVVLHKEDISTLHSEVRKWKDDILNFEVRVGPIDEVVEDNQGIQIGMTLMGRLQSALSFFFDDTAVNFQRVYVADTCALMHMPEIISTFEDGKAMLIVPVLVQSELDGLKDADAESEVEINDEPKDDNMHEDIIKDGEMSKGDTQEKYKVSGHEQNESDENKSNEKQKRAYQAREVIRQIERYRSEHWLNNTQNSCPELLSRDLDPEKNDCKILSIAIKYIHKKVTLITDDVNLRNLASSQHISSMDSKGYMRFKAHEYDVNSDKKKKRKKKKGK